jgi:hypothetical protein
MPRNLDDISTANRYFRYECAANFGNVAAVGIQEASKLRFVLPPLNEVGFNDHFNQCLVKIKRVIIGDGGEFNPVWADTTGALNFETLASGISVETNIPCRNYGAIRANAAGIIQEDNLTQRFGQTFVPKFVDGVIVDNTNINYNTELPNAQTNAGQKKQIVGINGAVAAAAAATPAVPNQIERGNGYYVLDDNSSIFDTGLLCGVPFGSILEVQFKSGYGGVPLVLTDYTNTQVSIGGVAITLEFLMLPNRH